jgi:hypothetical protein
MKQRDNPATSHIVMLALALSLSGAGAVLAQPGCSDPLTLRVSDAIGPPGGLVGVVIRTYASRPVGQGQVDLRAMGGLRPAAGRGVVPQARSAEGGDAAPVVVGLEHFEVFSSQGDVTSSGSFEDGTASLSFESLTGSINDQDGPLAVLWLRLAGDVAPGEVVVLDLVLPDTFLVDGLGQPIPVVVRAGELLVRAPDDPYVLAADGDDVVSGQLAELGVETLESFPVWSGQVALTWNPLVVDPGEAPRVRIDPRYGDATWQIEESVPGRLVVSFDSPDGSLNSVPGAFLEIGLRMAAGSGDEPLGLDAAATFLADQSAAPIPLLFLGDEITFGGDRDLFADGFECGGTGRWSSSSP